MRKLNWAVAGIGDIARRRVLPAILTEPRSALYGLITRSAAKASDWPGARVWATVEQAVADPAVDALYIALPVALHAPAAIAALRAGKHVLSEKPMAMSSAEAARMEAEARAANRLLGAAYYRRLYPKLIRAKQLIADGAIGQPVLAEANCHGWLNVGSRAWLLDPAMAGGGPLYDVASHRIDAMNFLFGTPGDVCGLRSNAVHQLKVEDSATVLMRFAGGVHGIVDVRWNSHVARDQFRILGTEGEIDLDPLNGPELRIEGLRMNGPGIHGPGLNAQPAAGRVETLPPHPNLHFPLIANFVDAVEAGRADLLACPGDQAAWVDWTIEQAGEQAAEQTPNRSHRGRRPAPDGL